MKAPNRRLESDLFLDMDSISFPTTFLLKKHIQV